MNQNNPLKQYFRRPAIYLALPSKGKYYQPGVVNIPPNDELPVYPMSSIDEMTIKTPDGLFNGDAVVRVIKSCIPDILDPWQLNSIDLEAVIVAIRAASGDGKIEINSSCPRCEEQGTYTINLMGVLAEKREINFDDPLKIRDLEIKFRPLPYSVINKNSIEQFNLQRTVAMIDSVGEEQRQEILNKAIEDMNSLTYKILTQTIEHIKTPETTVTEPEFITEFLINTDSQTNNTIREYSIALREKNDTRPLKITCQSCNHEYQQSLLLNFSDFFE